MSISLSHCVSRENHTHLCSAARITFTCAHPQARPTQQIFFPAALHRRVIWSSSSQLVAQRRLIHRLYLYLITMHLRLLFVTSPLQHPAVAFLLRSLHPAPRLLVVMLAHATSLHPRPHATAPMAHVALYPTYVNRSPTDRLFSTPSSGCSPSTGCYGDWLNWCCWLQLPHRRPFSPLSSTSTRVQLLCQCLANSVDGQHDYSSTFVHVPCLSHDLRQLLRRFSLGGYFSLFLQS
jgi:hypothetical protein